MTVPARVTLGSRTSPLALAQSEEIVRVLRATFPETEFVVVPITTGGDRARDAPLLRMPRGLFVKEIESALLDGQIDLAVHSAKDLPSSLPQGLVLAAIGKRQDPRDVLVNRWGLSLTDMPEGARLGTSSPRRTALLLSLRGDIRVEPIRGNVGTRLDKERGPDYDGVVLAAAGLLRLGRESEISEFLDPEVFTPDVGQGALAIEARADASDVLSMLSAVHDGPTGVAVTAERAFLTAIGGGCTVPVAAYARVVDDEIVMNAMAAAPDGSRIYRVRLASDARDPGAAGARARDALMVEGAGDVLEQE